jgi:hypothetical protein
MDNILIYSAPELVMQIAGADDVLRARFDVVLAMK